MLIALGDDVPKAVYGRRCPTDTCHPSAHGGYHYWRPDQYEPKSGGKGVMHWAWDLSGTANETMVYAPEDGLVMDVAKGDDHPWTGFQPGIVLIHGVSGVYHVLGHLQYKQIKAVKGQFIALGQPVGVMGIGHTHWEIRKKPQPDYGKYPTFWQAHGPNSINPADWLSGKVGAGAKNARPLVAAGVILFVGGIAAYAFLRYRGRFAA